MFDTLTRLLNMQLTATAEVKPLKRGKMSKKYLENADYSVRYARQLAQAKYRSEAYELTPTEWRVDNVCIVTRRTHACNYKKRYAAKDWTVEMYAEFDRTDKIRSENPS